MMRHFRTTANLMLPGVDRGPKSAKACKPSLRPRLGSTAGSEGGAAGVPSSSPKTISSGGGASISSSGGAPVPDAAKFAALLTRTP